MRKLVLPIKESLVIYYQSISIMNRECNSFLEFQKSVKPELFPCLPCPGPRVANLYPPSSGDLKVDLVVLAPRNSLIPRKKQRVFSVYRAWSVAMFAFWTASMVSNI